MNKRIASNALVFALFAAIAPGCVASIDAASEEENLGMASDALTTDTLLSNQRLDANQSIVSANGKYKAVLQGFDSHFVVYNTETGQPIWATGVYGQTGWNAVMQGDGNFVIYNASEQPKWATGTNGTEDGKYFLRMEDTGSLVLYRGTPSAPLGMLWSSTESVTLVKKFAPRLRFDGAAPNYPMSAETFYAQKLGHRLVARPEHRLCHHPGQPGANVLSSGHVRRADADQLLVVLRLPDRVRRLRQRHAQR